HVTIYLPHSTPPVKAHMLESWGTRVIFAGAVWDEANHAALQAAEHEGLNYFHPVADPLVIAGQGTIGLEILQAAPGIDTLLVAIGGRRPIRRMRSIARRLKTGIKIIGIKTV